MPLVAPALQVTINGSTADGPYANVLHVDASSSDPFTAALAVLDQYVDHILPVLCSSVRVRSASFIDLSSSSGQTGEVVPTATGTALIGGVTTEALPPQVAYLARLGGVSDRGVRNGRMYLPGVRKDEVDDRGDVSGTVVTTVQTAVTAFISGVLAAAGGPLLIVHNPSGGTVTTTEVLGSVVETPTATQRRRLKR